VAVWGIHIAHLLFLAACLPACHLGCPHICLQGKTVQAIAVASAYRDEWPMLIIAPSSLRGAVWWRQLQVG